MSSAILYLRVSTDEQASKGYSLSYQEDVLRQYCQLKEISIQDVYSEDHSAKSFNRPEWKRLMSDVKSKKKLVPDYLLFTKWDRFSRNTGDSYFMIKTLQRLFIEPQAVEQPIDLSVPENKMMLAFYLAVPEVENDRRGLNVQSGMRKARQEGRWLGPAPIGYKNYSSPDKIKSIIPTEPEMSIIKRSFEQLEKGIYTVNEIYRQAIDCGLNCSRSNFSNLVRNPVYAGKIRFLNQNRQIQIISGQHTAIVSSFMFDNVQAIINKANGSKVKMRGKSDQFILKSFISCPKCQRSLTASSSTGRSGKRYSYYHCTSPCKFRLSVEKVDSLLHEVFEKMFPVVGFEFYKTLLQDAVERNTEDFTVSSRRSTKSLKRFDEQLIRLKTLFLDGAIELNDYRRTKSEIETKVELLGDILSASIKHKYESLGHIRSGEGKFSNLADVFLTLPLNKKESC